MRRLISSGTHIETAVAGFHVKDWDFAPLGRDDGQATVGVAQNQHGLGPLLCQDHIRLGDGLADGLGGAAAGRVQVMLGTPHAEFFEEDAVQFVVVVLTGVDQHVVGDFFQHCQHPREPDDLRTGADNGHNLEFAHLTLTK